jgi:hypothetical protein
MHSHANGGYMDNDIFSSLDVKTIIEKIKLEIEQKNVARSEFSQSTIFQQMCSALSSAPFPIISTDDITNFEDATINRLGWSFATKTHVQLFFDVVADPQATSVIQTSITKNNDSSFDFIRFVNHGFTVSIMFGQGTRIVIEDIKHKAA